MTTPLVSFNHLSVSFAGERSRVRAVQEVSSPFRPGKPLAWWVNPAAAKASLPWR